MRSLVRQLGVWVCFAITIVVLTATAPAWAAEPCPEAARLDFDDALSDIDPGWTGLAHDNHYVGLTLTLGISGCAGSTMGSCGACTLSGPLANGGGATFNNKRCVDKTWLVCESNSDCVTQGAAGPCHIFFGPPLPYAAGGVSVCVTNEITGPASGTTTIESGDMTANLPYLATIYSGPLLSQPCPLCISGTCNAGDRNGMPCTVNGTSPTFGPVSFDCPPLAGGLIGTLVPAGLTVSTTPQTKTLSAASPNCRAPGFTSLKCFCDTCNNPSQEACDENADCPDPPGPIGATCGGRRCFTGPNFGAPCSVNSECPSSVCTIPGQAPAPNQCDDGICYPGPISKCSGGMNDGSFCSANSACPGGACVAFDDEDYCAAGPFEYYCGPHETFRGCFDNADCAYPGDTCSNGLFRKCFVDNGVIGNSITAVGVADPPVNSAAFPTLGSLTCIPHTISGAVNTAAGFPGPGRLTLPTTLTLADETETGTTGAGGTVTSDTESDGATPSDPVETSVTTPNAGQVIIDEQATGGTLPGGYTFLGKQVLITAPAASAASPLILVFRIDASRIPVGENENTITVFKDGVPIANCTGAGATPDPCVGTRALLGDGDVELTIRTSTASQWNFGIAGAQPAQLISGKKILIKDKPTDPTKRKIVFLTKDPAIDTTIGSGVNPVADGAFFQVYNPGTGDSACFQLPNGSWQAKGDPLSPNYKYKDSLFANGACKVSAIKDAKLLKVVCLAKTQPISYTLDEFAQGSVAVTFESGTTKYCTVFGGLVSKDSGTDPPNAGGKGQFKAKDALAPASCPAPPVSCP